MQGSIPSLPPSPPSKIHSYTVIQTNKWYDELSILDHKLTMERVSMTSKDPNETHNRAPVFDDLNYDYWKKKKA